MPDEAPSYLRSEDPGYRVLLGTGTAVDLLVWARESFERQLHLKASFPSTVLREGKLLYGFLPRSFLQHEGTGRIG